MTKKIIVDPPSGWQYGYPKALPPEANPDGLGFMEWLETNDFDLGKWFADNGYPKTEIGIALKYSRFWEE